MKEIIKNHWPIIFLLFTSLIICFTNYTPNTFLSGWDTLHPEFNFPLNIERAIFGVFRPEQGLGAVAGHSHMADLPRILTLYLFDFFLPIHFLRYSYIFLMLIIGPIGLYFFLYRVILKDKLSSFLGALFYLLNIGTMQIFVVPFEMFVAQYGFLPWLMLFATEYLTQNHTRKKYLILFYITTTLATPIAYAATLWHIQFIFLLTYIFFFTMLHQKHTQGLKKRALQLIITTLLINSFWLLPNLYFIFNHGKEVSNANINTLFSPQAFLYNKEFGNIKDIALMKTFYFDWNIYTGKDGFDYLLQPWIQSFQQSFRQSMQILLAIIALIGILYGFVKKKISTALIPCLIICLFLLFNNNPPTGWLFTMIQRVFPLFQEAMRFPENKVLGLYIFLFAVFFGMGQYAILKVISRLHGLIKNPVRILLASVSFFLLFFIMRPAFQGNFINPSMRVQIPQEYFSLFDWLNNQQDDGRIANFPIHSFWGWEYYDWYQNKQPSFQGAGFLWFGFKQPFLNRDFDRWNLHNEQYYKEMSYAVYSKNPNLIATVISKYDIHYLLLDKNIIAPQLNQKVLFYKELEELFSTLIEKEIITKGVVFGKNITVYKVNQPFTEKTALISNQYAEIFPKTTGMYEDLAYQQYGNYITRNNSGIYYPFLSLTKNTGELKAEVAQIQNNALILKQPFTKAPTLSVPSYFTTEEEIPAEVVVERLDTNQLRLAFYPYSLFEGVFYPPIITTLTLDKKIKSNQPINATLSINETNNFPLGELIINKPSSIGKIMLYVSKQNRIAVYDKGQITTLMPDFFRMDYTLQECDGMQSKNSFGINIAPEKNSFALLGTNAKLCMTIPLLSISGLPESIKNGQKLFNIQFAYKGEKDPDICMARLDTGGCIKNLAIESFGILPAEINGLGIKITFDTTKKASTPISLFGAILNQIRPKQQISYNNIFFFLSKPIASKILENNIIQTSVNPIISAKSANTISIPLLTDEAYTKSFQALSQSTVECGSTNVKDKNENKKSIKNDYVEYNSTEGPLCDSFAFPNLSRSKSYIVAITSKHINGLPLTICITNPLSGRCDIYTSLTSSAKKKTSLFLIPPMSKDGVGFTIDLNNFAVKKTPSINELYNIQVIPFPYTWITSIASQQKENQKQINNLLTNTYSFEKGWRAYKIVNGQSSMVNGLKTFFPFLFGKELKDHVLVNNWANGWIIPDNYTLDAKRYTLVIVFLPQYLQYLGFVLLSLTILWLLLPTAKSFIRRPL